MSSGKALAADGDFELLTASSGTIPVPSRANLGATKAMNDALGHVARVVRSGKEQLELEEITGYLQDCKTRLLKEHREEQEAEWQANRDRVCTYLEDFRAKKRQLSMRGAADEPERRVAARTESSSRLSSSSSSSSASPPPSSRTAHRPMARTQCIPTEAAYFHAKALYPCARTSGSADVVGGKTSADDADAPLTISPDGRSAVMQENGEVTAVLKGVAALRACARISFQLGRDNSGNPASPPLPPPACAPLPPVPSASLSCAESRIWLNCD
jgi:hypothetical protein